MPSPVIPPHLLPKPHGIFELRGGPLCGAGTDVAPDHCIIGLVFVRPGNRKRRASTFMCKYRWHPDDCLYEFVGMEPVIWG